MSGASKPSQPDRETFWQRTLRAFTGDRVVVTLSQARKLTGRWTELSTFAGKLELDDGRLKLIDYSELRECERADG